MASKMPVMSTPTRWLFASQITLVALAMVYTGFKYNPLVAIAIGIVATILWIVWISGMEYESKPHPEGQMIEHWAGAPDGSENE